LEGNKKLTAKMQETRRTMTFSIGGNKLCAAKGYDQANLLTS